MTGIKVVNCVQEKERKAQWADVIATTSRTGEQAYTESVASEWLGCRYTTPQPDNR